VTCALWGYEKSSRERAALLAEFMAKESQAHERKPKKGTGRSRVGNSGGGVPVVIKGDINGNAIRAIRADSDKSKAIPEDSTATLVAIDSNEAVGA